MSRIDFKVEVELGGIFTKGKIDKAQREFTKIVRKKSDPYIPLDKGPLKNKYYVGKDTITYYARKKTGKSYAAINYYTNKGRGRQGRSVGGKRGSNWTEEMWRHHKDEIEKEVADLLTGGK
ncbi:MAG: hypothetical protein ACRDD7_14285 [Peptostreptococcaceae bacterium]